MAEKKLQANAVEFASAALSGYTPTASSASRLDDLLCDLMHYADAEGIDFDLVLASARMQHARDAKRDARSSEQGETR